MNLIDRYKKPTPRFFKILRNVGIALGSAGAVILASPVALPAAILTLSGYVTLAGTVITAVSQAVVSDGKQEEGNSDREQEL